MQPLTRENKTWITILTINAILVVIFSLLPYYLAR